MRGRAAPDYLAADEGIAAAFAFNSCPVVVVARQGTTPPFVVAG